MRSVLTALSLFLAAPAFAGGTVPAPAQVPAPPQETWTGFYAGFQYDGYAEIEEFDVFNGFLSDYNGTLSGVFFGYRRDFGNLVVGGEFDWMHGSFERDFILPGLLVFADDPEVEVVRFGLEVGYDFGNALPYATAGYTNINLDYEDGLFILNGSGVYAGFGVDYLVGDRLVVGVEYIFHNYNPSSSRDVIEYELQTFGINAAVRF